MGHVELRGAEVRRRERGDHEVADEGGGHFPLDPMCTAVYTAGMERIGIRELRQDLSNQVKKVAGGGSLVITVDGEPKARLPR